MLINGFYHIFAINDYKSLVFEQLQRLKISGLIDKTNIFYVGLIGSNESISEIVEIFKFLKIDNFDLKYWGDNKNLFEFPTINFIGELSKNSDFYCYYIHTKGISISPTNYLYYGNDYNLIRDCVINWREYMEYFIIDNHSHFIDKLSDYDAAGVSLVDLPICHYSGNFWWSKSSYLKKLRRIGNESRYAAEFWIGNDCESKLYSAFNECTSYNKVISIDYKNIWKSFVSTNNNDDINIISAFYDILDVKNIIIDRIYNNSISILVCNHIFTDPNPGVIKILNVIYEKGGCIINSSVFENDIFYIN